MSQVDNGNSSGAKRARTDEEGVEHIVDVDDDAPTSDRNGAKRNTFWTVEEEGVLACAWIHVTEDSLVGNCQKKKDFWRRLTEYFHQNSKTGMQRRPTQIKSHWHAVNQACILFSNIMTGVTNEHHSDWSDDQIMETVRRLYLEQTRKHFKFEHMWNLLKRYPKWLELSATERFVKKTKISALGAITSSSDANTTKVLEEDEEDTTKMASLEKVMASLEKVNVANKLLDRMTELTKTLQLQILFKDTSGMTEVQKKRYEKYCQKIAVEMELDDD